MIGLHFGKPTKGFDSLVACLLLTAVTLAVYGQLASHQFHDFDDSVYIFDNAYVLSGLTWRCLLGLHERRRC